jgi:hypothetical protein
MAGLDTVIHGCLFPGRAAANENQRFGAEVAEFRADDAEAFLLRGLCETLCDLRAEAFSFHKARECPGRPRA